VETALNFVSRPVFGWLAGLAALVYLVVMGYTGAYPERRHLIKFEARGLLHEAPERVERVTVTRAAGARTFVRAGDAWRESGKPLSADAREAIDNAVKFMHRSEPVRSIPLAELRTQDSGEFGLAPPRFTIQLTVGGATVLEAGFGNQNPMSSVDYVGVVGRDQIYLLSHFVSEEWQRVLALPQP
jgi:hypothetical protein